MQNQIEKSKYPDPILAHSQRYRDLIFEDLSGYTQYEEGEKENAKKDSVFLTYGEILPIAISQIIAALPISAEDVFYDLGSGIGKPPLQFFMDTPIKRAIGIEASKKRHSSALTILETVHEELPELFLGNRTLEFKCENFLQTDLSDATLIYIASTCFSPELMLDIGEQANATCRDLRYLVTLKAIPNLELPLLGMMPLECTWDKKTNCHFYGQGKAEDIPGLEPISE